MREHRTRAAVPPPRATLDAPPGHPLGPIPGMLSAPGMVPAAASSRDLTSMSRAWPEARSERSSGSETVGAGEGGMRAWSGAGCAAPLHLHLAAPLHLHRATPLRASLRRAPPRGLLALPGAAGRSGRGRRSPRRYLQPWRAPRRRAAGMRPRAAPAVPTASLPPPGAGTGSGSEAPPPGLPPRHLFEVQLIPSPARQRFLRLPRTRTQNHGRRRGTPPSLGPTLAWQSARSSPPFRTLGPIK